MRAKKKPAKKIKLEVSSWHTTDAEEIERRRLRGQIEKFRIENGDRTQPYFSSFWVTGEKHKKYHVEIRSLSDQVNSCECRDYMSNQLGTCKHIEHVLFRLRKSGVKAFKQAQLAGSSYAEIFFDTRHSTVCMDWPKKMNPAIRDYLAPFFSADGRLTGDPIVTFPALQKALSANQQKLKKWLRLSHRIEYFVDYQRRLSQRQQTRDIFFDDLAQNKPIIPSLKCALYPYQQEGMVHLAATERALLADDMGLGKTVQAIAACEWLRRDKKIQRVLVVATASLKAEWEEQISKFTELSHLIIQGSRANRLRQYEQPAFFYLTNYEQIVVDGADIQRLLAPDVIILDEAQRIKNWHTKTADAVKQLKSRYAFVLTGTPLENRIDDVYSIVQFLDPHLFGALFRFNRDFYVCDEKGKPIGYKNLDVLHQRLRPIMLRRRKEEVEGQLPSRTSNNYFIKMDDEQLARYEEYKERVARIVSAAKRRPLRKEEFEKMQKWLACMRMLCDTPYILDQDCRISPKLRELGKILPELLEDNSVKIIIFSEWERMLQLVRELATKKRWDFAWHTGSVPQHKRRGDIKRFKENPACRLFLSTDSGSVGLNLQAANIVINLDLPWNPAKLEQRIARAWRKHQVRSVRVINLVSENTIEHRMLDLLAQKQALSQGVLDGDSELKEMQLPSGRAAFMERMESLMESSTQPVVRSPEIPPEVLPVPIHHQVALLESHHHEGSGRQTMLAVVDKHSEDDIQDKIRASLPHQNAHLEILDRHTFEIIQRLAEAGVLTLHHPAEVLHASADFAASKKLVQDQRMQRAKKYLSLASHKQRMAQILVGGEFHEEAFPPLREALESTICAFSWLVGRGESDHSKMLSHHFIQEKLVGLHGFPDKAVSLFSEVSEKVNVYDRVKKLLADHQDVFLYVDGRLNQMTEPQQLSDIG